MPNNEMKHTPLPWLVGENGFFIYSKEGLVLRATCNGNNNNERKANAKFIVTACTAYYELIDTLELLKSRWDATSPHAKNTTSYQIVEKALKKAKGN